MEEVIPTKHAARRLRIPESSLRDRLRENNLPTFTGKAKADDGKTRAMTCISAETFGQIAQLTSPTEAPTIQAPLISPRGSRGVPVGLNRDSESAIGDSRVWTVQVVFWLPRNIGRAIIDAARSSLAVRLVWAIRVMICAALWFLCPDQVTRWMWPESPAEVFVSQRARPMRLRG